MPPIDCFSSASVKSVIDQSPVWSSPSTTKTRPFMPSVPAIVLGWAHGAGSSGLDPREIYGIKRLYRLWKIAMITTMTPLPNAAAHTSTSSEPNASSVKKAAPQKVPPQRKAAKKKAAAAAPRAAPVVALPKAAAKPKKAAVSTKSLPKPVAKHAGKPAAKLVRDSFTMPQREFGLIAVLKDRALDFKRPTRKSELLRAGLQALAAMNSDALKQALDRLAPIKTGRPRKHA